MEVVEPRARPPSGAPESAALRLYWTLSVGDALSSLHADAERGLPSEEEIRRCEALGANVMEAIRPTSAWILVLDSFKEPMMIMLLSIAGVSVAFGKIAEAVVMIFVVVA